MSWLRLDDGFPQHPKFEGWTAAQKWAFVELMAYCAKYRTEGRVPADLTILPRSVTATVVRLGEASGWLDRDENGLLWIHDFEIYNGQTVADRVAAFLSKRPDATANEVYREVGGKRELVLSEIARLRGKGGSREPEGNQLGNRKGTEKSGSQSGSRARAPHPSPKPLGVGEGSKPSPEEPTPQKAASTPDEWTPETHRHNDDVLAADLPPLTEDERQANIERIRELQAKVIGTNGDHPDEDELAEREQRHAAAKARLEQTHEPDLPLR